MNHLNTMMDTNFPMNDLQISTIMILVLLFVITFVKWNSKKRTGVLEVILVGLIPVVLFFANFFSKSEIHHLLK